MHARAAWVSRPEIGEEDDTVQGIVGGTGGLNWISGEAKVHA
jgi:hypothetical protein